MKYICVIFLVLFSACSDDSVIPNKDQEMPKGFTNDSIRIYSVVPYSDTINIFSSDGVFMGTSEDKLIIKNYATKPVDLFSYIYLNDSVWVEYLNKWVKKRVYSESGWFFRTNNWKYNLPKNFKYLFGSYNGSKVFTVNAKSSAVELPPNTVIGSKGELIARTDFLNREGDTLYLYKYNKTDTVLVDMIWWKNAQRNQVFYHQ